MFERSGVIDGHKWFAEKVTPSAITCVVKDVQTLDALVKDILPAARDVMIKQLRGALENGFWKRLAFSQPFQLGVFLFDPRTGAKMGNYGAQYDVTKDMDAITVANDMFDKVTEGCRNGDVTSAGTGLATQFEYFSPLHVQIGLEFGLREPFSIADA